MTAMAFPVLFTRPQLGLVDLPEGGEQPSPKQTDGMPSTQSSENESASSDRQNQSPRKPVPTTASHFNPIPQETSDVVSTDGNGPETQPQPSAKPAKRARTRVIRETDEDFSEFD